MILGPDLGFFCCYYGWLPWSDPKPAKVLAGGSGTNVFGICRSSLYQIIAKSGIKAAQGLFF
jgi:hypothetical protein